MNRLTIGAMFVLVFTSLLLHAEDWPRFRGDNGASINREARNLPVEFGPAKNLLWRMAIPFAKSSPVAVGGRVFLTAMEKDTLIVFCIDQQTGKILWRRDTPRPRKQEMYHLNEPASPTPTADGENVYVFFPDLGLIAYSHAGVERWRHPLEPFRNFYGMAGSPIVAGEFLILNCDQQSGSYLLALDSKTGKRRWRTERPNITFGWTTPIVYTPPSGPKQVIVVSSDRVDAFQINTGERQWWFPIASNGANGSPVLAGDTFYVHVNGQDQVTLPVFAAVATRYDVNKDGRVTKEEFRKDEWFEHFTWLDDNANGLLEDKEWERARTLGVGNNGLMSVKLGGSGRLAPDAVQWRYKKNIPFVPAPVLIDNVLLMVRNGGVVTSVDARTGALIKQGRAEGALGSYYSQPVLGDGKLFLLSEEGKLAVLSAQGDWRVLAVNDLGEEAYATPAIAGNRLFVRTRDTLFCFGVK